MSQTTHHQFNLVERNSNAIALLWRTYLVMDHGEHDERLATLEALEAHFTQNQTEKASPVLNLLLNAYLTLDCGTQEERLAMLRKLKAYFRKHGRPEAEQTA